MYKIELLAPVKSLEQLKIAIAYGADSVYIGGEVLGMKYFSDDFSREDLREGVNFAHENGKKVFVTVNVLPHNDDFKELENYLKELEEIKVDAIIIADPGVLTIIKNVVPNMEVHLSNQANTTNYVTANFWNKQGIKRVTVSRELSFKEISEIRAKTPFDMDIDVFIQGPICISYSGRCLISNYLNGRVEKDDTVTEYSLIEEKRPGEYYPVHEDKRGTFFYNSKDLCMIEFIPELIKTGANSLKIEGNIKSNYYLASVIRAYKMAIDEFYNNPTEWKFNPMWLDEIKKSSNRDFTTGFYLEETVEYNRSEEDKNHYEFIGTVIEIDKNGLALIRLENDLNKLDEVEIIAPLKESIVVKVEDINNTDLDKVVKVKLSQNVDKGYMLRREI